MGSVKIIRGKWLFIKHFIFVTGSACSRSLYHQLAEIGSVAASKPSYFQQGDAPETGCIDRGITRRRRLSYCPKLLTAGIGQAVYRERRDLQLSAEGVTSRVER